MRRRRRGGFTLVELLVVIAIVITLVGLFSPCVTPAREAARSNVCRNNLRELHKALVIREASLKEFPGYINAIGTRDKQTRASWVVDTLPYIDQVELWESWSQGKSNFAAIELLVCPSNPPVDHHPKLSYVANAGYIANADGIENKANGIFFDRTRTASGASGLEDAGSPQIVMTMNYIQAHDGAGRTLLLTESIRPRHWGYSAAADQKNTLDRKYHFGFCWEQPSVAASPESTRRINGNWDYEEFTTFGDMNSDDGFPSSNHPGGINVVFAGGSTSFISDRIDPLVFAQLMTSNHEASDLVDVGGKSDSQLEQPTDSDY